MPSDPAGKTDVNEQAAFSELFNFLDADEAAPAKPAPHRDESDRTEPDCDPDIDDEDIYAPLSAEITHQKWFADELDTPVAEDAPLPKPSRPAVRLAEPPADAPTEAMQQALSALGDTSAYEWPGPALPQHDDAGLGEFYLPEPVAVVAPVVFTPRPAPPPQITPPEHRAPPSFMKAARAPSPFAPPQSPPSPLTARDGAPAGIEASLSALESVLGGSNSPSASNERDMRSALVREADLSDGRREAYSASAYTRSPLGQIADRIVRELENLPAAPRRAG